MTLIKHLFSTRKFCAALTLLAMVIPFAHFSPAHADDDLLQLDTGRWMSFDHYKEKTKGGKEYAPDAETTSSAALPQIDTPNADGTITTSVNPQATYADGKTADGTKTSGPQIAAPARPLNVPVMPGMNKGYNVSVSSTEDERAPVAQITHMESEPTVSIPSYSWQKPAVAMKMSKAEDEEAEEAVEHPLNIRFSSLPNAKITPIPSPEYNGNHGRAVAQTPVPPVEDKSAAGMDKAGRDAIAALDAYKKRQLEAIQSDRETLTALQGAISELGLQKQLNFMTGAKGEVNQQADNSPQLKIDAPPSLAAPAKN